MIDRNELGEKIFTDIYSVIIDNGLNIDPLANELGDEIDDFVELILDCSERNEEWAIKNLSVGNVVRNTKNHFAQLTTFLYVAGVRVKKKKAGY